MNLPDLARSLGCVEVINVKRELKEKCTNQSFKYLLVLDFEATCWDKDDLSKGYSEIIEFPCVLYNVQTNSILSHFQQFVMPMENPKLSQFCKDLTGISQTAVDNGVPIKTCLMLFKRWLEEIRIKYNISLQNTESNNCIFATWSDWDIKTCLKKECKRKQIIMPDIFNKWMDVRALYKRHYMRVPKGLFGALQELGLDFEGRQHSGLDDANNTCRLIGRMIAEGVVLECTSFL